MRGAARAIHRVAVSLVQRSTLGAEGKGAPTSQQLMEMHAAMVKARKEIAELKKEKEETEAKEREMVDTLASTGDKVSHLLTTPWSTRVLLLRLE
jgi:hypothetical protein